MADLIGSLLGFLFTLLILSYLLGDNPFFRLASSLFVGVAAGYAGASVWHTVVYPKLFLPLLSGDVVGNAYTLIPLALAAILLLKVRPSTARFGNVPMAYLVGVGAAVAIGGAVNGTLFPQTLASAVNLNPTLESPVSGGGLERVVGALVILVGTIATIAYFHFGASASASGPAARPALVAPLASVGQVFIAIAFGALYAGTVAASIAVLVGRVEYVWGFVRQFSGG